MTTLTPSRFGALDDGTPFCIPMPGLFVDLDAGFGSVALTDEFFQAPAEVRFGVLQQWLRALSVHKDSALVEMFREYSRALPGSTIVEQIESFRHHCNLHGIGCPADLAVLVQRY